MQWVGEYQQVSTVWDVGERRWFFVELCGKFCFVSTGNKFARFMQPLKGVYRLRKFAELFRTREHLIRSWEPTAQMLELFITCVIRIAQVAVGTLEARQCGQRVAAMCACGVDHEFSRHSWLGLQKLWQRVKALVLNNLDSVGVLLGRIADGVGAVAQGPQVAAPLVEAATVILLTAAAVGTFFNLLMYLLLNDDDRPGGCDTAPDRGRDCLEILEQARQLLIGELLSAIMSHGRASSEIRSRR
eukprot:g67528.t1